VPANRPRGLCWNCYYTPGLRDRYVSTSKYGYRADPDFNGRPRLADVPTSALPGTPEKVAVLAERARARLALFHPDDAGPALVVD
jgi:hypothetical protein